MVQKYLEILKDYFGNAYAIAKRCDFNREKYEPLVRRVYTKELRYSILETLVYELTKLDWKKQESEAKEAGGLKVHYVGAEYSYRKPFGHTSEFIRKTGLYADKVVVEDQLLNRLLAWDRLRANTNVAFNFVLDHAIDFLTLEPLFISESDEGLCQFAPASQWCLENNGLQDKVMELMFDSGTLYASQLFGKHFSSMDEVRLFISKIDSHEEFFKLMVNKEGFVTQDGDEINSQWMTEFVQPFETAITPDLLYETLITGIHGGRINDLVYDGLLGTIPVTDLRASWNSMNWLIKNDNDRLSKQASTMAISKEAMVISTLQQDKLRWLGNVPINKLCQLRERGELADLRRLISAEIVSIEQASDEEFFEVAKQVNYNINNALKKHTAQISDLREIYRDKYGLDIKYYIVSGAIAITSAVFQPIASATGIIATLSGIVPPTFKTLTDYFEERSRLKELQKKPVALLFEARNRAKVKC